MEMLNRNDERYLSLVKQLFPWMMCALIISEFILVADSRDSFTAAVCAFAFVPSIIVAMVWLTQEDLFNPLGGIWASLFIGTSLRTGYLACSSSDRVQSMMWLLSFRDLAIGTGIATLGTVAIVLGYLAAGQTWSAPRKRFVVALDQQRLLWVSILLGILAVVVAFDFFRQTGFDFSLGLSTKRRLATDGENVQAFAALGYHRWIACTLPCVLFYFWYWEFVRSRSSLAGVFAAAFFLLASGFAFLSSSRTVICVLLLNALYITHVFRYLRLSHLVIVMFCVIGILSVMLGLRQMATRKTSQISISDAIAPSAAVDAILGNENFADIGRLSLIYKNVPDILPYRYGMSYITWLFAPIPRTHWRNKPVLSQGLEVTEVLYGGKRSARGIEGGGRPPMFMGEAIMNFGWIGIPLCGVFYGIGLRLFQNFHSSNARSNVLLSVSILIPAGFGFMGGEFSMTLIEVVQGLVPSVGLLWFAGRTITGMEPFSPVESFERT